jgi:hypothetical protein
MLRGYRGIIAKVAGLAILAALAFVGLRQLQSYSDGLEQYAAYRSDIHRQNAEYRIKRVCPTAPSQVECVDQTRQAKRENQRAEQDLAAQKVTAWWTQVMGVAALIGMGLSAVGVWLVKTTFDETRKANEHSEAALNHAKNMAVLELRPYVAVEKIEFAGYNDLMVYPDVVIAIKNFGSTPANDFEIEAGWALAEPVTGIINVRVRPENSQHEIPQGHTVYIRLNGKRPANPPPTHRAFCTVNFRYSDKFGNRYGKFETYAKLGSIYEGEFRFHQSR